MKCQSAVGRDIWLQEDEKKMIILVMGPPGSGKSTQAELLASRLEVPFIQMGEEVRRAAQAPNERGLRIREQMRRGALVEDSEIRDLLQEIILSRKCGKGFVLDGAPRIMSQVDEVEEFIKKAGDKINRVILIDVGDKEAIKRLLKRGREDDLVKTIRQRLKLYHRNQDEVVEHYRRRRLLLEVDGERPVEDIFKDIVKKLGIKKSFS